jgi:hypothetical protein
MDVNLIAKVVSVISAPSIVPRFVGSASSPPSIIVAQALLKVAHVLISRVPPARGFLQKGFLRMSSSVVTHGCSPEPVQPSPEAMGLVWP